MHKDIKLFAGNATMKLAEEISEHLQVPIADMVVKRFSDAETFVKINENVRGHDAFVIQSTCTPVNDNLMELLLIIDALKRSSAARITAVIPYYGYARQDRKTQPRVPISSKLVADLITVAGTHRILTIDLHAGQIQGFFNIPVDHLYAEPVIAKYVKEKYSLDNLTVVSPDAGGVERARAFAGRLNCPLAIIDKRRDEANICSVMNVIGNVIGKDVILFDDLIDTAGTITQGARLLKEHGARNVYAACTHPVLSGPAIERLNESVIEELIVTNTIPLNSEIKKCPKIHSLSIAYLIGEAIRSIHEETSISILFV
ncbi:MAG: ribose-phosphate pyrophosphokinase [Candidatus Magnetoovum sp. WYHC-5]|nr:ribose-phosphate pyrophosphokinase [Candidatus Magnetoovum sp. WYHC-5]